MDIDKNRLYDLSELLTVNGGPFPLSRSGIYAAARRGEIPTQKIGKRLLVPGWFVLKKVAEPLQ